MKVFKNLKILNWLLILVLLTNCKKEGPIHADELIFQDLIGSWIIQDKRSINFKNDGSFIDSAFYLVSEELKIREVVSGRFTIHNEKLIFTDVSLLYTYIEEDESMFLYLSSYCPIRNFKIENDILYLEKIKIFEINNLNNVDYNTISGKWSVIWPILAYNSNLENKYSQGNFEINYEFFPNKNSVYYQYVYRYDTMENFSNEYKRSFNYNYPILQIVYQANISVSIEDSKMIWSHGTGEYERVQ